MSKAIELLTCRLHGQNLGIPVRYVREVVTPAPAAYRASAMARPMPRDPPVTRAILPIRSIMCHPVDSGKPHIHPPYRGSSR